MKYTIRISLISLGLLSAAWGQAPSSSQVNPLSSSSLQDKFHGSTSERNGLDLARLQSIDSQKKEQRLRLSNDGQTYPRDTPRMQNELLKFSGGVVNGGGGHFCKSQVKLFFDNIDSTFTENPRLLTMYPEWSVMREVFNPIKNPNFQVQITKNPIQGCLNTEDALACGYPKQNRLAIHCGTNGWNSLQTKERYKQLIHELYWWTNIKDANYHYSTRMVEDVFPRIQNGSLGRLVSFSIHAGDKISVESILSKVETVPDPNDEKELKQGFAGKWENIDGKIVCTENPIPPSVTFHQAGWCRATVKIEYSILLNETLSIYRLNEKRMNIPPGSTLDYIIAQRLGFDMFQTDSQSWFDQLENIARGKIYFWNQNGKTTSCLAKTFNANYTPVANSVNHFEFGWKFVSCP